MEKQIYTKLSTIASTLFDSLVGMYQVCDKDETDDYFKHYLVLIFKDRKPQMIYGIKNKDLKELLDDITYFYRCLNAPKEEETE